MGRLLIHTIIAIMDYGVIVIYNSIHAILQVIPHSLAPTFSIAKDNYSGEIM